MRNEAEVSLRPVDVHKRALRQWPTQAKLHSASRPNLSLTPGAILDLKQHRKKSWIKPKWFARTAKQRSVIVEILLENEGFKQLVQVLEPQ